MDDETSPDAAPGGVARPVTGPKPAQSGMSRRWALVGGGLALLAGGAGVGAAFLHHEQPAVAPAPPPAALVAAAAAERRLIADLDATTGGAPAVRAVIAQLRADHAAHLAALDALVGHYERPAAAASSAPPPAPAGTARTRAALAAAEAQASAVAAQHAAGLAGRNAVLLASISACEATHAELLR